MYGIFTLHLLGGGFKYIFFIFWVAAPDAQKKRQRKRRTTCFENNYPCSHNHGSVENGCLHISFLSLRVIFHFPDYGRKRTGFCTLHFCFSYHRIAVYWCLLDLPGFRLGLSELVLISHGHKIHVDMVYQYIVILFWIYPPPSNSGK